MLQDPYELALVCWLIDRRFGNKLFHYLEMGVGHGGVLRFVAEHWQQAQVLGIDDQRHRDRYVSYLDRNLQAIDRPIHFCRGNIRDNDTWLSGHRYDVVLIDAEHDYHNVETGP